MRKPRAKIVDGIVVSPGRLPEGNDPLIGPPPYPVELSEEDKLAFREARKGRRYSAEYVLALLRRP